MKSVYTEVVRDTLLQKEGAPVLRAKWYMNRIRGALDEIRSMEISELSLSVHINNYQLKFSIPINEVYQGSYL